MRTSNGKNKKGLLLCLLLGLCAATAFAGCNGSKQSDESSQPNGSVESVAGSETPEGAEYTVTFDTQGGSAIDPVQVVGNTKMDKPDNPTKPGHVFKGWYLDLNDTSNGSFMFDETEITGDITLYALWQIRTFNVSYQDENGNAVEGITGGVFDWGSTLTKPDDSAIARDGYIVKWYTAAGDLWNFETSKVTTNTVLTYRYVSQKDSYVGGEIADNFYPVLDKTLVGEENCVEHYTEGAETVFYTYRTTNLQQVVLNVELPTLDYGSVTIIARTTDAELDYTKGGEFAQLRAYIKTDVGGNVSYNDEPSSGYNPLYYYIQSTGANAQLCTSQDMEGGWTAYTFDLASLKFWTDATRLDAFAFGFVSQTLGIEIKSITFNKVDKDAEYTVSFMDSLGNSLSDVQTLKWNSFATKPETPASGNGYNYTGEWVDASGEVFDFENKRVRSNVVLYPEYTIDGKYSWSGTELAHDFNAVFSTKVANPAAVVVDNERSIFTYNNGKSGTGLLQVVVDNLNLAIGDYRYLTVKWRALDYATLAPVDGAGIDRVRIYLLTDLGGDLYVNNKDDKESYYMDFQGFKANEVTTPIDVSAQFEDGWYIVNIDLDNFAYFNQGTTLYGFALGTTTTGGNVYKAIEVSDIAFSTELTTTYNTVSFVDADGNAIDGLDAMQVAYGKTAIAPNETLLPTIEGLEFSHWVDVDGNEYKFNTMVLEDITLKAVYKDAAPAEPAWEGTTVSYAGQDIVDNFTFSRERYGDTISEQNSMTLVDGNAVAEYTFNKPNKAMTMLNAGIRIHEGSKLVITFKSTEIANGATVGDVKIALAFRGEDPATTIYSKATNAHYFKMADQPDYISYTLDGDVVTATFDLFGLAQVSKANVADGANIEYLEAFTFLLVEKKGSNLNTGTLTFTSIQFVDVQQEVVEGGEGGEEETLETITYAGQQIIDNFKSSYERYGNTLTAQNALTLVDGKATADYTTTLKANKVITMLNAGIVVKEGSKMVVTFKSSAFAEGYTYTQFKMGIAFRGEDPATTIHNKANPMHYFQYTKIEAGTLSGSSDTAFISFEVAEDGTVTVTLDLYAMSQASASTVDATTVDVSCIDAFSFMIVETNSATSAASNGCTITFNSIQFVNVKQSVASN